MTGMSKALPAGLPDRVQLLLAEPPAMEKMLIELSVTWPGLTGGLARISDAVRLFVITWDPLEGMLDRSAGFATTNGGRADLEIVVYLPTWSLVRLAAERDSSVATVMGAMAGSALVTAAQHEETVNDGRYPDLAARGAVPDLLADPGAGGALGAADIDAVSAATFVSHWPRPVSPTRRARGSRPTWPAGGPHQEGVAARRYADPSVAARCRCCLGGCAGG